MIGRIALILALAASAAGAGTITEIIGTTDDGMGNPLVSPKYIAVGSAHGASRWMGRATST